MLDVRAGRSRSIVERARILIGSLHARITIDRGGLEVGLGSVKPPYVERRGASSVLPRTSIYPPRARPIETLERDRDTIGGGEMREDGGVGKSTESI